ncbi:MAG: c-type cytochrome [Desulfuromonadaceae bacterium]|nr:c-type cytochrome [Desulfuromonadaceae bacterium]
MNYPVWYLPEIGGGLLMVLIAVTHVFVSHFAVGGGLYLVATEHRARRANDFEMLEFLKKHTKFFMLVSMVYGGVTGVGIWFTIGLIQPDATSDLIHAFVFGWAAEWVWFLVEIVALLVYYYRFDSLDERTHLAVGWIYFVAAWMSLFLINGIIDFMLTPGEWLQNHNFWSAFFNPTFWPSLLFRFAFGTLLAGVYAFFTTAKVSSISFRLRMTRYSSQWCLISLLVVLVAGAWYVAALPSGSQALFALSPTIRHSVLVGAAGLLVFSVLVTLFTFLKPSWHNMGIAILVAVCSFLVLSAFEWIREADRRPYVINNYRYSNGIAVTDVTQLNQGFLAACRWSPIAEVTPDNVMQAGQLLFKFQCYACHTLDGVNNDIRPRTASASFNGMVSYLVTMHEKRPFMPPFVGTELERKALAAYLVGELHGKEAPVFAPPRVQSPGEVLFEKHSCSMCHAAQLVFDWAQGQSVESLEQGLSTLSQIDGSMKDFAGSAQERRQLADYLLAPQDPVMPTLDGRQLLDDQCVMCHDAQLTVDWAAALSPEQIRQGLLTLSQINSSMEDFSGSEAQLDALVAYLERAGKEGVQ